MEALDYPIKHFAQMNQLASKLKILSAQILEHSYQYDSFGTWWIDISLKSEEIFRLFFDGKDRALSLYKLPKGGATKSWQPAASSSWNEVWKKTQGEDINIIDSWIPEVVDAIERWGS